MPDEIREITVKVDQSDAVEGVKQIEKELGNLDDKVKKTGQTTVTVMDKSRSAHERMVKSFEKRVEFAGMNKVQTEIARRDAALKQVGDQPALRARVEAAGQTAINLAKAQQAQEDYNTSLQRAIKGSREAAEAQKQFDKALETVNRRLAQQKKALDDKRLADEAAAKTAANIVERARYRTAGAVGRLEMERGQAIREARPGATAAQLAEINRQYDILVRNQEKSERIARTSKLTQNIRSAGEAIGRAANAFAAFGAVLAAPVVWLVKTGAELERTQIAFENLLGSKQAGQDFFQSLQNYSKQSVFSLQEIAKAAQQALALGFKPEMAQRVVRASFAVAAAMGQQADMAGRVTLAIGQMQAKQRVSAEEMNQLSEAGVGAWKMLAAVAGKEVPEMMKLAEKGMINADIAVEVLTETILRRFGEIEKIVLNTTTFGKFQQLRKSFVDMAQEMRGSLLPIANNFLEWGRKALVWANDWLRAFARLDPETQQMIFNIAAITAGLVGVAKVLSTIMTLAADIGLVKLFKSGADAAGVLITKLGGFEKLLSGLPGLFSAVGLSMGAMFVVGRESMEDELDKMDAAIKEFERKRKGLPREMLRDVMEERYVAPTGQSYSRTEIQNIINQAEKQGMTKAGGGAAAAFSVEDLKAKYGLSIIQAGQVDPEKAAKAAEKAARKYAEEIERARTALDKSMARGLNELGQVTWDYQHLFRELVKNPEALKIAWRAFDMDRKNALQNIAKEQRKEMKQRVAEIEEEEKRFREYHSDLYQKRIKLELDVQKETINIQRETMKQSYEMQIATAEAARDYRRTELEVRRSQAEAGMLGAHPREVLAMKIEFERQASEIEIRAAEEIHTRKMAMLEIEAQLRRDALEDQYAAITTKTPEIEENFRQRRLALDRQIEMARTNQVKTTEEAIARERLESTRRTNDLIIEEYRRQYDQIYDAASGILDNLLAKSRSWADVMKSIFKAAILTPVKEAAAHWIAGVLTPRPQTGAQQASTAGGGHWGARGGSLFDAMRRVFGFGPAPTGIRTPPTFDPKLQTVQKAADVAASGAKTAAAAAETTSNAVDTAVVAAKNAETSAQLATASAVAVAGKCCQGGGGGVASQLIKFGLPGAGGGGGGGGEGGGGGATQIDRIRDLIGLGNPQGVWQGGGTLGKLATSNAALLAGVGLLYAGLSKNRGWASVGMSTAGGALVGAKIGTMIMPGVGTAIGAAVGAVAGFTAGMIRKSVKGAEQKMIEQVKTTYGVTISKQLAAQFVEIAKNQFGGDIRMAVVSPQIRELVQLYAMATGQKTTGMPRPMYGVQLAQTGGQLQMQPVYESGYVVSSPYGGPTTANYNPASVFVQLNPQQANQLFEGRVVQVVEGNPQAVSNAQSKATQGGVYRNANRGASLEPLTTLS
jgi:tape measure domain-containing protein